MKTKNSIRNSAFSFGSNIIMIITNFFTQTFFIKILGNEYLGLNGLFTNIISMLSIVDLGIGSAIIYNLYKPIQEQDTDTINSLLKFYKKTYHLISVIIALLGFFIMPFLNFFIKEITININIYIVFSLFLFDTISSYLLSYKRSILIADQKNYIINIVHTSILILLSIFQITLLYITNDYYLYLIIRILFHIMENYIINYIIARKYKYITKDARKLKPEIEKDINKKVKSLIFHKIGGFMVSSTDNIIISKFLGLITVGMYSNYSMIINAVTTLFSQVINSITASVGHLLVENNPDKNYLVFKRIRFINFWISTFASTSILVIIEPFIKLWLGEKYLLDTIVLYILVFNLFQMLMRNSYSVFKEAAGIFYEDRFIPLIESLLNIVFSILLVKSIGLIGVFIGTAISGLILWFYSYPKLVYKRIFNGTYKKYIIETMGYIIVFVFIATLTSQIASLVAINSYMLKFLVNCAICITIPNIVIMILFIKNENFIYCKNLFVKNIKKHTN